MSAAVNAGAPVRHRSRNPRQPKRSRYTDEAMSVTWYWLSSSRHIRLSDRLPPVASCSDAAPDGRRVHRLTAVAYFSRISCGNCGRQGTSASGEDPTEVSGSVSSQA
jgi:hypothetical protein